VRWKTLLLPPLFLGLGAAVAVYLTLTRPEARPQPPAERVWAVDAITLAPADITPRLEAYGTVVAAREAALQTSVSGRVVNLDSQFREGAEVEAGQPLLDIDPFQYRTAVAEQKALLREHRARLRRLAAELAGERALLAQARDYLDLQQRDLTRTENLQARELASERTREAAALAVNNARQALLERQRNSERLAAQQAEQQAVVERLAVGLERAERDLRDTTLHAPFAGYLQDVAVALGQRLTPQHTVARLIARDALDVEFSLADHQFARLLAALDGDLRALRGRPLTVAWQVGEQVFDFEARLDRVAPRIRTDSGSITLYGQLEDHAGILRPGAFVTVAVAERLYREVVALPDGAVSADGEVWLIDPETQRLQAVSVAILAREGEQLLVRGPLPAGDRVVAQRRPDLAAGVKVQIRR